MMDDQQGEICRVCILEAEDDRPLFYPCKCRGSIKYTHQDCLMQWIHRSHQEQCHLCGHPFSFQPVYSPNMPQVLPLGDVCSGVVKAVIQRTKSWLHFASVVLAWFGVVPLSAYQIYQYLFRASTFDMISLPLDVSATENLLWDALCGYLILIWLWLWVHDFLLVRFELVSYGVPDWFIRDNPLGTIMIMAGEQGVIDNNENDNDNDEPDWLNRTVEALTWRRLLGFDGYSVFLIYVFWIISGSAMLIFGLAFCPYCIGNFILKFCNLLDVLQYEKSLLHFHILITTVFGYCFVGLTLVILHFYARLYRMRRVRWLLGFGYVMVKITLLSMVYIGVQPLLYGCLLDICSLPLFDASLSGRKTSFLATPGTSLFVHWTLGMIYIIYLADIPSLLREILRPGVLWFLPSSDDAFFSNIRKMIHLPILHDVRVLMTRVVIFGSATLLMLWLPAKILQNIWPAILPYALADESEVIRLGVLVLLLQIILPCTRIWLINLIQIWCLRVTWLLGLKTYLLTSEQQSAYLQENDADADADADAYADADTDTDTDTDDDDDADAESADEAPNAEFDAAYDRPSCFPLRLVGLLMILCVTLVIASLIIITVPVTIGRRVISYLPEDIANPLVQGKRIDIPYRSDDLYMAALGTYLCWILCRGIAIAINLLPQGRAAVIDKMKQWMLATNFYARKVFVFILLGGIIPLLFGLLLQQVVVIPLHVIWKHWVLGVYCIMIAVALILMGPDCQLQRPIEQAITRANRWANLWAFVFGLPAIDLKSLINGLATLVIRSFGLASAILSRSILPMIFKSPTIATINPVFFLITCYMAYIDFEIKEFKKLCAAIKKDKYLMGYRLVNHELGDNGNDELAAEAQARLEHRRLEAAKAQREARLHDFISNDELL